MFYSYPPTIGTPGSDIKGKLAFDIPLQNTVKVAVLDTGFDLNNPEISDSFLPGYDFVDNDNNPFHIGTYHGTKVTGVITSKIKT